MRKTIVAACAAVAALTALTPTADAQWRRRSDIIIERPSSGINANTLAVILALQAARRAAERDTTVIRERSTQREFVPLK